MIYRSFRVTLRGDGQLGFAEETWEGHQQDPVKEREDFVDQIDWDGERDGVQVIAAGFEQFPGMLFGWAIVGRGHKLAQETMRETATLDKLIGQ